MKIKLVEPATWAGYAHRKGSVHEVNDKIGQKLIDRGYAELHKSEVVEEKVEDAPAAD